MPSTRALEPSDPERLGDHAVIGRLGTGGQGVVYLGLGQGGSQVAIKVLHARLGGDPLAGSRFVREAEAAGQVATSCAARVLAAGMFGDRPYIVSEYVEGPSLEALVAREGPRGRGTLERLAIGTATALTAIHLGGVVHRDFEPGNVLLGADGPRVIDFGIAGALDAAGTTLESGVTGTPGYMAPEQLDGAGVGPAADVFAWGATMLFAATGRPPFGDGPAPAVLQRIMYDQRDLSALPESLRDLVGETLAPEAANRPTARQVLDRLLALESLARGLPRPMAEEARTLAVAGFPRAARSALYADPRPPAPRTSPTSPFGEPAAHQADGSASADLFAEAPAASAAATVGDLFRTEAVRTGGLLDSTAPFSPVGDFADGPAGGSGDDRQATAVHAMAPWEREAAQSWQGESAESAESWQLPPAPGFEPEPSAPPRARRDNRTLGVLMSLAVGVLAGAAIIVLVLWPQLEGPDGDDGRGTRQAADNQPVTSIPQAFAGTWRGTAFNPQRNASFPLVVSFEAGQTTARARYTSRNCTTTLALTRGTGTRLEMKLTPDPGCAPRAVTPGEVVVTRKPDGTLDYAWAKPGTTLSYRAALRAD